MLYNLSASVMHLNEFHVHAIMITGGFDENDNILDSTEFIGLPDLPVGENVHVWSGQSGSKRVWNS